jgi:hypothetical protein
LATNFDLFDFGNFVCTQSDMGTNQQTDGPTKQQTDQHSNFFDYGNCFDFGNFFYFDDFHFGEKFWPQILKTNFGDKLATNFDNKFWQQILTYLTLATFFALKVIYGDQTMDGRTNGTTDRPT